MKSFFIFSKNEGGVWTFELFKQDGALRGFSFVSFMTKEEAEEEVLKLNRGKYD